MDATAFSVKLAMELWYNTSIQSYEVDSETFQILAVIPSYKGDGDWDGWGVVAGLETNAEEECSITEGVLRMDAVNKPEELLFLYIMEDWKDYSFSADMRIIEVEPGAE